MGNENNQTLKYTAVKRTHELVRYVKTKNSIPEAFFSGFLTCSLAPKILCLAVL